MLVDSAYRYHGLTDANTDKRHIFGPRIIFIAVTGCSPFVTTPLFSVSRAGLHCCPNYRIAWPASKSWTYLPRKLSRVLVGVSVATLQKETKCEGEGSARNRRGQGD